MASSKKPPNTSKTGSNNSKSNVPNLKSSKSKNSVPSSSPKSKAISMKPFSSTATTISSHHSQVGTKDLGPAFLSLRMASFTEEEEPMMDTRPTVLCWPSKLSKCKVFQFPDASWSLKEMRKAVPVISKPTLKLWRKELETQLFFSVLTAAPSITKESGWPTLWEACWLPRSELM